MSGISVSAGSQKEGISGKEPVPFLLQYDLQFSPLSLLKDKKQIDRLQPEVLRLAFTSESAAQTGEVLDAYVKTFLHQEPVELEGEFTRGHFKRGVE